MSAREKELEKKLRIARNWLKVILKYPPAGGRRTEDGYPTEIHYDEFAYKRIVDSYRKAAEQGLKETEL